MTDKIAFEDALSRIEEIANRLGSGEVRLDEALKLYKEGADLSRICLARLKEAEKEIKTVEIPDEETHTPKI